MDIKQMIRESGLKQWQVAEKCGISEWTLVRWLRHELPEDRRNVILKAIESLSKEVK